MDINNELDRIRGHGFKITIYWGEALRISASIKDNFVIHMTVKRADEKWGHCMYRAILEFDAAFPELR